MITEFHKEWEIIDLLTPSSPASLLLKFARKARCKKGVNVAPLINKLLNGLFTCPTSGLIGIMALIFSVFLGVCMAEKTALLPKRAIIGFLEKTFFRVLINLAGNP